MGGNLWRTGGDIRDSWESVSRIGFSQDRLAPYARPGHWNDPDMLEVGNGHMTDTEYRTHMSLWSMLAAPLIAGNDVRNMSPSIHDILTNREVIAIDQDKAGHQGKRIWQFGQLEIWTRELAGGDTAVAVFNRAPANVTVKFRWAEAGVPKPPSCIRDLWRHTEQKGTGPEHPRFPVMTMTGFCTSTSGIEKTRWPASHDCNRKGINGISDIRRYRRVISQLLTLPD